MEACAPVGGHAESVTKPLCTCLGIVQASQTTTLRFAMTVSQAAQYVMCSHNRYAAKLHAHLCHDRSPSNISHKGGKDCKRHSWLEALCQQCAHKNQLNGGGHEGENHRSEHHANAAGACSTHLTGSRLSECNPNHHKQYMAICFLLGKAEHDLSSSRNAPCGKGHDIMKCKRCKEKVACIVCRMYRPLSRMRDRAPVRRSRWKPTSRSRT